MGNENFDMYSEINDAAGEIKKFWSEFKLPDGASSYAELLDAVEKEPEDEDLRRALIHPKDWEKLDTSQREIAMHYVNGHKHKLKSASRLYPIVPQPFMGDLKNPKVVVVTFNPGFHEFVDWVLAGPYSEKGKFGDDEESSVFKEMSSDETQNKLRRFFDRMGYRTDGKLNVNAVEKQRKRAEQSWIKEQQKLLTTLTRRNKSTDQQDKQPSRDDFFIPWQIVFDEQYLSDSCDFQLPSPLNLHGKNAMPWTNGNWHCDYFRKDPSEGNHLRNYIDEGKEDSKNHSGGIAQIELLPYQSPEGKDLKPLAKTALQEAKEGRSAWDDPNQHLIPSQKPIFNYLVAVLTQVLATNTDEDNDNQIVVIVRGSAAKTEMFHQAMLKAGGDDLDVLKEHVYKLSSQSSALTLKQLESLNNVKLIEKRKPKPHEYEEAASKLLGNNFIARKKSD